MVTGVHTQAYEWLREFLIEQRKAARMTQEEVATRLGRPQSFVAKYESGNRRLDAVELIRVARAIGFDPAALIKNLSKRVQQ